MIENFYAVIMAGGGGTRLWPLSRQRRPKQMLKLGGERSLFQVAVDRLQAILPPERILVVTVEDQAPGLQEQCPEIPPENFLLETMPRGTASVVGYAAVVLNKMDPDSVMAVLTADHIIGNLKLFQQILKASNQVAGENYLVTLGITPTFPATGYGYTRQGESLGKIHELDVYQVREFTEKPALPEAERIYKSGEYAWNSGMFIWRTEVMENAEKVAVIPALDLEWNDVGSWEAIFDLLPQDKQGNINEGIEHIALDTRGTLVYGENSPRLVVTIGVEDLIIVDTGDILLVCNRDQAQDVRQVVKKLKEEGRTDLI